MIASRLQRIRTYSHLQLPTLGIPASPWSCGTRIRHVKRLHSFNTSPQAPTPDQPFEEGTLPGYEHDQFYPVHIGESLHARYNVIGKLGFGANSTVWLCRDTKIDASVAVKVYVRTPPNFIHREQAAYEHLSKVPSSHPGRANIRQLLDYFSLRGFNGDQHVCFVYEPLHTSMLDFQKLGGKARPFPEVLVKSAIVYLLEGLDHLHTEADMIHCDIKLSNLMLRIEDPSVLAAFEEDERASPSPKKIVDTERTIYASRQFRYPQRSAFGPLVLCDFGEARIGTSFPYTMVQPEVYRAPEVLLMLGWDQKIDIWNVACVVWDMLQIRPLFDGRDEEKLHNNRVHIGEMVGLLGHPPLEFQRRSEHAWRVFDDKGRWKGNPPLSADTLEDRATNLIPESKGPFLAFLRSMLRWRPEDRPTARELLNDPWLQGA